MNHRQQILLKGYYGFGNFGDDLLLIATESIVRQRFPNAEIFVFSNYNENLAGFDQRQGYQNYIHTLVSGSVRIIDWSQPGKFDLIVHGGGGVFFSTGFGGWCQRAAGGFVQTLGARRWARLARRMRILLRRTPRITGRRAVALGVGVGPFSLADARFLKDAEVLGNLQRIAVRDEQSLREARELGLGNVTECFTDLAFGLGFDAVERAARADGRVGLVICDGKAYSEVLLSFVRQVGEHKALPIFFDENCDRQLIEALATEGFTPHVWRPRGEAWSEFARGIGSCEIIISNRAHGVIVAALLGVPSIVIDSDPKLHSIHRMLPTGTVLAAPKSVEQLQSIVVATKSRLAVMRVGVASDVNLQRSKLQEMINFVL